MNRSTCVTPPLASSGCSACRPKHARVSHPTVQTEPLRLHKNIGMAIFIFVLWDASLLWLAWLACGASWAPPSLHDHRVLVVGGCSAALVGAEVAWAVGQWRQERAKAAAAADGLAAALLDP